MASNPDVIIIGAGVSGLCAAYELQKAGKSFVVLEARNRVGGRTWSEKFGKDVVDYGGQWIGPVQPRVNRLVEELGIGLYPTYGEGLKLVDVRGRVSRYKGLIPSVNWIHLILMQLAMWSIDRLARKLDKAAPWTHKKAKDLDGRTLYSWQKLHMPTRTSAGLMNGAIRVIFGCEPRDLSLLHVLHYFNSGGGLERMISTDGGFQHDRLEGGAQELSNRLAAKMKRCLKLNAVVDSIQQDKRGVIVRAGRRSYKARRVIVALPPTLIGKIAFTPELPALKNQLVQRVPMGAIVKIFVEYDRPFWREKGLSGEAVSMEGVFTVVFDNVSRDEKTFSLLGFVAGDRARTWNRLPGEERRRLVLNTLVLYFGPEAANPLRIAEADWTREEHSGGAPIGFFPTNTLSTFGPELRAPTGFIFWAGTETAREFTGFIEGAVEAGQRAAEEVLDSL